MQPRLLQQSPRFAASVVAWTLVLPFLFLLWIRLGAPPVVNDDLDPSWTLVVAHALEKGWRWGHDIAFTYGPLGFLHPAASHWPPLAEITHWAQIAIALLAAFIGTSLFVLVDNTRRFALILAPVLFTVGLGADPFWIVVMAFALLAIAYQSMIAGAGAMLYALVVAAAAFVTIVICIKISMITIGALWLFATCVVLVSNRRWGVAITAVAATVVLFMAAWLITGQSLADLVPYFRSGLEFSAGYGPAMSFFPVWWIDASGGLMASAAALIVLASMWANRRSVAWVAVAAFIGLSLFLAWRLGYTRADPHTMIFFACIGCLLPQLPRLSSGILRPVGFASMALGLLAVPLFLHEWSFDEHHTTQMALRGPYDQIRTAWERLFDFDKRRESYRALSDAMQQRLALTSTTKEVGTATVDLVGYHQASVLYNNLNYSPRPIFQSYAAYTPNLARLNEAFIAGERAPDYVMLASAPIDGHLPSSEDPLTLIALLRRYTPVLIDGRFLLLKKAAPPIEPFATPAPSSYISAKLGEWIEIPSRSDGGNLVVNFSANLSLPGKLAAILVREPYWYLELQTDQGAILRYRTSRLQGNTGFLISPLVNSLGDWLKLFAQQPLPRVAKFRVMPHSERLSFLTSADFSYALTAVSKAQMPVLGPNNAALTSYLYPGFNRTPDRHEGNVERIEETGQPALYMHAPAALSFDLPAGNYRMSVDVGIRSDALKQPACSAADGIVASISTGSAEPIASIRNNPFADKQQANPVAMRDVLVSLPSDGTVTLRLGIGEQGANGACDWSYVRNLRIDPSPDPAQPAASVGH